MKATIGRTVIVHGLSSNGSLDHPATITRAWSDRDTAEGAVAVNLTVFPDGAQPQCMSSVMLYETQEAALASCANLPGATAAYWPPRA